ncbi:unnamed protein product [Arabidopsis halleri]
MFSRNYSDGFLGNFRQTSKKIIFRRKVVGNIKTFPTIKNSSEFRRKYLSETMENSDNPMSSETARKLVGKFVGKN